MGSGPQPQKTENRGKGLGGGARMGAGQNLQIFTINLPLTNLSLEPKRWGGAISAQGQDPHPHPNRSRCLAARTWVRTQSKARAEGEHGVFGRSLQWRVPSSRAPSKPSEKSPQSAEVTGVRAEALGRTLKAVGRPLKLLSQRPLCRKRLWLTQPRSRWPKLARPQRPGFRITALS